MHYWQIAKQGCPTTCVMVCVKLLNNVGSTILFSPTTSLLLFNEAEIENVLPTMLDNLTTALWILMPTFVSY